MSSIDSSARLRKGEVRLYQRPTYNATTLELSLLLLQEERQRDLARREAQRHQLQQTQIENEAQRAEARRQKLLEGERDKKLMDDYNTLLEAQVSHRSGP